MISKIVLSPLKLLSKRWFLCVTGGAYLGFACGIATSHFPLPIPILFAVAFAATYGVCQCIIGAIWGL